jgi:hypothetical protein
MPCKAPIRTLTSRRITRDFHPLEYARAVTQIHARQDATSGMAFRQRYDSVLRALQGVTERKPKLLLDGRGERNAAVCRVLPGAFHEGLV